MGVFVCMREADLTPDDPRWIGCWWLGYVIIAVGILVTSVPLWFFPSSMTSPAKRNQRASNQHAPKPAHKTTRKTTILRKLWKHVKGFDFGFVWTPVFGFCASLLFLAINIFTV